MKGTIEQRPLTDLHTMPATHMENRKFIDFNISTGKYAAFLTHLMLMARQGRSTTVCVANVHMFIEAYRDRIFLQVINAADVVTPDGQPLTWGLKLLYGVEQDRVAGMDLLPDLLKLLTEEGLPVYFYGGSEQMLAKTSDHLREQYPGLKVAGLYSPPFRPLSDAEEKNIVQMINASGAKVVFVVLGCPKQEKWMAAMKGRVDAVMIGIGGALPVMVGLQKRAPLWMQKTGLEWLYRLGQEPQRLFKRYAVTNTLFIWVLMKEFIKIKILRKSHT